LLPRRNDQIVENGVFINCHTTHTQVDQFFFLLQSEYGDLYKVTMSHNGGAVSGMTVQFFDTI